MPNKFNIISEPPTDAGPVQKARQVGKHDNRNKGKVKLQEKFSLLLGVEDYILDIRDAGVGILEFQSIDMVLLGMVVGHRTNQLGERMLH